jgi:hypothetical protein
VKNFQKEHKNIKKDRKGGWGQNALPAYGGNNDYGYGGNGGNVGYGGNAGYGNSYGGYGNSYNQW